MESEDYEFYKGLDFLLENKVSDLGYDLTFSTEIQEFGVTEVRDLIADGRNVIVRSCILCYPVCIKDVFRLRIRIRLITFVLYAR